METKKKVLCQKWEESEYEPGWGVSVRPDGCSLHTSENELSKYVKKYWDSMPDETPDIYSRPDGDGVWCEVSLDFFREVKEIEERDLWVRVFQRHINGDINTWLDIKK